jgi:hypothetical protein
MINYEAVCDDCPLRAKVDVDCVGIRSRMGTDGVSEELHDGKNRYTVHLLDRKVEYIDNNIEAGVIDIANRIIEVCSGPDIGLLRSRCAAGLATTWRWAEINKHVVPNVESPYDIEPLLAKASYLDALPYTKEYVEYVGSLRNFSELDCGRHSPFHNIGIAKLTHKVIGNQRELPENKAVMLDDTYLFSRRVYRLRIAKGGPHFIFLHDEVGKVTATVNELLAEGIFKYINADKSNIEESDMLSAAALMKYREDQQALEKFFNNR